MDNEFISLKSSLTERVVGEEKEGRKVLLNLNDKVYQQVCDLLKKNDLTFNAFINNFMILLLQDKVKIESSAIKEIIR